MNKKEIIEKIKKCLALSKSANQHEAATALRQAQALMEKYNIDADDAELLGIVNAEILGSGSQKPPVFESMLAQSIAKLMDCKVFLSYQVHRTTSTAKVVAVWHFTGFDPAPEIASYAFDVLYRQLKKARTNFNISFQIHFFTNFTNGFPKEFSNVVGFNGILSVYIYSLTIKWMCLCLVEE